VHSIPQANISLLQHVLDTYASEISKTASTWRRFDDRGLAYRPHEKSATAGEIMRHELLSGRRFFGEFLGLAEPPASSVLEGTGTVSSFTERLIELAQHRLAGMADRPERWWLEEVQFFDVRRSRIWIVWRRILHSAHHRTQLTVYLRLMGKPVPAIYGPSSDETWDGADPTNTIEAAER
jgi:uncharacterized damage-inducible protein DinB